MTENPKPKKELSIRRNESARAHLVEWLALPVFQREPKTQAEFAKNFHVHFTTVSSWKAEPGFMDRVRDRANEIAREGHPDVVKALLRNIHDGDTQAIKIYPDYFQSMKPVEKIQVQKQLREWTDEELEAKYQEAVASHKQRPEHTPTRPGATRAGDLNG
jgi:hypothetical protein